MRCVLYLLLAASTYGCSIYIEECPDDKVCFAADEVSRSHFTVTCANINETIAVYDTKEWINALLNGTIDNNRASCLGLF